MNVPNSIALNGQMRRTADRLLLGAVAGIVVFGGGQTGAPDYWIPGSYDRSSTLQPPVPKNAFGRTCSSQRPEGRRRGKWSQCPTRSAKRSGRGRVCGGAKMDPGGVPPEPVFPRWLADPPHRATPRHALRSSRNPYQSQHAEPENRFGRWVHGPERSGGGAGAGPALCGNGMSGFDAATHAAGKWSAAGRQLCGARPAQKGQA